MTNLHCSLSVCHRRPWQSTYMFRNTNSSLISSFLLRLQVQEGIRPVKKGGTGVKKCEESSSRSIVKGITWRILASISTLVLSYAITGNILFAGLISILDMIIKFIEYFLHERIWAWIPWGYQRTHLLPLDE